MTPPPAGCPNDPPCAHAGVVHAVYTAGLEPRCVSVDCACGELPSITDPAVAATQPHAMVNAEGDVFYPDSLVDAAYFATLEGARPVDPQRFNTAFSRPHSTVPHIYLSTACLHAEHDYCGCATTGDGKPKTPATCKFCDARCICGCHQPGGLS